MGKLLHVAVYVFAVIGILMTAGVGYVYVANSQLMGEFWSVKDDFRAVPDERRTEVVAELPARITAEAAVAREAKKAQKDVKQVAEEIEKKLGKVNVGIDLTGKGKSGPDNLADVNSAKGDVADARLAYGEALESRDGARRVTAAVGVLEALDKLGDKVQAARKKSLSADEKDRLSDVVKDAKATLYDVKQTPKLSDDAKAKKLMASIPQKLNE